MTKDKYEGCDPEIAEDLKTNLYPLCEVWNDKDNHIMAYIINYESWSGLPYITSHMGNFKYANKLSNKKKIKKYLSPIAMMQALLKYNYKPDERGYWVGNIMNPTVIPPSIWTVCGTETTISTDWMTEEVEE